MDLGIIFKSYSIKILNGYIIYIKQRHSGDHEVDILESTYTVIPEIPKGLSGIQIK